jgi:hypothetical protein
VGVGCRPYTGQAEVPDNDADDSAARSAGVHGMGAAVYVQLLVLKSQELPVGAAAVGLTYVVTHWAGRAAVSVVSWQCSCKAPARSKK